MNNANNLSSNKQIFDRIRRNHALEHATLKVLGAKQPGICFLAQSSANGLVILGNLETDDVRSAAEEACQRLKDGEHQLATHANCGTNLATTLGIVGLSGLVMSWMVSGKYRRPWQIALLLPLALGLALVATFFGRPLGILVQKNLTINPDLGNLEIESVKQNRVGHLAFHTIKTREG